MTASGRTTLARLTTDQATAARVFASLCENLDPDETACSLYEVEPRRWTVSVHFQEPPDVTFVRGLVATSGGTELADLLSFDTVDAADWVKLSYDDLPPVPVGRFVVHGAHDRDRVPPNRIGIEIAAALAFGTGHHGTTQGCLMALESHLNRIRRPQNVLDVGTGTGVLAIAAAKAMRRPVVASDIDQQAVMTARANARLNRAGALTEFVLAAGVDHRRIRERGRYDLVLANILLVPLQRLARPIVRLLAPQARVILSGLLPAHANAALAAYRSQGLALERCLLRDGWVTLILRRGR